MGRSLLVTVQLLFLLSWGIPAQAYIGFAGRDGYDASNGSSGQNGPDVEIVAAGQAERLVLDGTDGNDAFRDGENGGDAYSCYMTYEPSYDVEGAPGGDGGDGGNGGSGGRGGDATIYYTDTRDLKNVVIVSRGGRGGDGSRGGYGGRGCICYQRSWTKRYCREETDRNGRKETRCYYHTYYCRDGRDGRPGSHGYDGSNGRLGKVTLIKSATKLEANVTSKSGTLGELLNRDFIFKVNRFAQRAGAVALLGAGSIVDNNYTEWLRQDVYTARVVWESNDNYADFTGTNLRLYVSGESMMMDVEEGIWLQVEKSVEGGQTVFRIKQALKASDVSNISFAVEGKLDETQLRVLRGGKLAERVASSARIVIWKERFLFGDKRVFDAVLDESQVAVEGDDLIINLGRLAVEDRDIFKAKAKIKVKAVVTRSFNGESVVVDSGEIKYTIPR